MPELTEIWSTIHHGYHYFAAIILIMTGFYAVITGGHLVKKLIGMMIFQTSVLLIYITSGYIYGARAPIIHEALDKAPHNTELYANPLPHVLMLTAIVVGIATIAVGLALVVRIKEAYGTAHEDEILEQDLAALTPEEERESDSTKLLRN